MTPFALSTSGENCFLVSYAYGSRAASKYGNVSHDVDSNGAGVYLIDCYGNKELVYRHPIYCAVGAIPFRRRARPPVIPDSTDYTMNHAVCVVPDVYEGMDGGEGAERVERGTVKYIRISEALPWPIVPGSGVRRWDLSNRWCPVRVIGTVPVEEDGSAHFKVPAVDNASVYFQALDANFMEIRRMRSSISFQPGERRSCNGCHETKAVPPSRPQGLAAMREPDRPLPPEWGARRAIGYEWLVQPILDLHCVKCHGGKEPKKGLDFTRGRSYQTIVKKARLVSLSNRMSDGSITKVKQFGSHRSRLTLTLLKPHPKDGEAKVQLSKAEWIALVTWVDANAPYREKMLNKRPAGGGRARWEVYEWKDPWAPPAPVPATGVRLEVARSR